MPEQTIEQRIAAQNARLERTLQALERTAEALPRLVGIIAGLSARVERMEKDFAEICPLTPAAESQDAERFEQE